jgi:hypothetical protein
MTTNQHTAAQSWLETQSGWQKRYQRFILGALLLALLLAGGTTSAAQTYSFFVPELRMQVFVQPDASVTVVYDITFANSPAGRTIDIVDIGMPHDGYNLSNMSASMDGESLTDIRVSEVVNPGVEIHLYGRSIPPGRQATLHFEFNIPDMVYQDTTNAELASLQITPTWFDSNFVSGTSRIWIVIHMLPEVQPDEVLYQDVPFSDKVIFEEHTVAVWQWENGSATGPYLVGVSFPQRGMTRVIEQSVLDLAIKWLEDKPQIRLILGALTFILFAFAFFRFSGGTGLTVFVIVGAVLAFLLYSSPGWQLLALPGAIVLVGVNEWFVSKRKVRYLPAIAQVEGGGIKRGLTAPEAAVLLELPLNKVLTLIIFGLLEKGIIRQVKDDPLEVVVTPEFNMSEFKRPGTRRTKRLKVAQDVGMVVRDYEHAFLDLLERSAKQPVHKIDFSDPMKSLIGHTAERIKGFDLSDTQDYYRKIIKRALDEARRIGDIPEREKYLDRHMQWLLLDDGYRNVFVAPNYHYRPIWIRPYASSDRIGMPSSGGSRTSGPSYSGKTSFGDVAASFAGWTESTMGRMADAISPGSLQVRGASGIVNLSGVDKVTGDIFEALAKSSSGSGGSSGGGSCACACAGCACACACAGGGR